jgi:hypothetical protein
LAFMPSISLRGVVCGNGKFRSHFHEVHSKDTFK